MDPEFNTYYIHTQVKRSGLRSGWATKLFSSERPRPSKRLTSKASKASSTSLPFSSTICGVDTKKDIGSQAPLLFRKLQTESSHSFSVFPSIQEAPFGLIYLLRRFLNPPSLYIYTIKVSPITLTKGRWNHREV